MKRVVLMLIIGLSSRLLAAQMPDVTPHLGEQWYGLYMNGQKAGYAVDAVAKADDGTVAVSEDARIQVNMAGVKQDMRIFIKREYGADGALRRVEALIDDPANQSKFDGTVNGDRLKLVSTVAGKTTAAEYPKPTESVRDALKLIELVRDGAKVGERLEFSVFEPVYQQEVKGASRVVGTESRLLDGAPTQVFKIETTVPMLGVDTVSYVTETGVVLEDIMAGVITMRLEPEAVAKDVNYSNDTIVSNAAKVVTPIENPRERATLALRVKGPLNDSHLFNNDRQVLEKDGDAFAFRAVRMSLSDFPSAPFPVANPEVAEWLRPTLFVQSDDPRLVKMSREIIKDETDTLKAVEKLCQWVHDNVRTTFSARLTNALEVLQNLQGDCTEHSVLFVGLARACGIPAREVAGLIYVEGPAPGFYFHQWAEVWAGKWLDVDPTFNQVSADVTHIKLAEGDLFNQTKLLPIIGRIEVEVTADSAAQS